MCDYKILSTHYKEHDGERYHIECLDDGECVCDECLKYTSECERCHHEIKTKYKKIGCAKYHAKCWHKEMKRSREVLLEGSQSYDEDNDNPFAEEDNPFVEELIDALDDGRNIALLGGAGVGKSFSIKKLVATIKANDYILSSGYMPSSATTIPNYKPKRIYVTATTGVAALNLSDDGELKVTTLHRFAGIRMAEGSAETLLKKITMYGKRAWEKCDILIIDEVSMLGATLFQKLDTIAKTLRRNNKPFGGIQLVVSGDFLQLPPVKDKWVFACDEWKALNFRPFIMEVPKRYVDVNFFYTLLRTRIAEPNETDIKIFKGRVGAYSKMKEYLEEATKKSGAKEIIRPTVFYSRNIDVDSYNIKELDKLPDPIVVFNAQDTITKQGVMTEDMWREFGDSKKALDAILPQRIVLKVGAQVMLRVNIDVDLGLVNGSRGVVYHINKHNETVTVKFLNGCKHVIPLHQKQIKVGKKRIVTRKQIPLILAYAITIHKCQGCSMDYAVIDVGNTIFEDGQAYVALSRCRSIQGLFISSFSANSIKANKHAVAYTKELRWKWLCETYGYGFVNGWLELYKTFVCERSAIVKQLNKTMLHAWKDVFNCINVFVTQIATKLTTR